MCFPSDVHLRSLDIYVFVFCQSAEKEEFEHQQRELEKLCNPLMTKLGAGRMPSDFPGPRGDGSGPTVEEVD